MPLRTRLFIVISIIFLIILGISLLLILRPKANPETLNLENETTAIETEETNNVQTEREIVSQRKAAAEASPELVQQNAAKQLAKIFIERYGSFSTDNNFDNIKDVKTLVTAEMWKKISGRIGTVSSGSFTGTTVTAIGAEITKWSGNSAAVRVKTRKDIEQNGEVSRVYQDVSVSMVKSQDGWLADSFTWIKD